MKKLLLVTASAAAIASFASSAFAADLPVRTYTKAQVYAPAPVYNWTGFYIGGHVGGAFAGDNTFGNNGRFLGGVQAGADYQFSPNWVLGIEGQYSWTDRDTRGAAFPGGYTVSIRDSNLSSVTGRIGYTWGPGLLYVKGGAGFRDNNNLAVTNSGLGTPVAFTNSGNTRTGYTVGAGVEYMFTRNWSAKLEYQYYNFGNDNLTVPVTPLGGFATTNFHEDVHTVKAGLNYRFNFGG
jgi:outer membrane immunogenic protein